MIATNYPSFNFVVFFCLCFHIPHSLFFYFPAVAGSLYLFILL